MLQLVHARRGIAALEFALMAPAMLIVFGAAVDFGMANYDKAVITNAVAAGAQYAIQSGVTGDTLKNYVKNMISLPGTPTVTVGTATNSCLTSSGTSATLSAPPSSGTCSDGTSPGSYLTITVSYSFTGLLGGFSIPLTLNLSDSTTVRVG